MNDRRLYSAHVAMIGAGQLARMTLQAAIDLSIHLEVLAAEAHDPAVLAGSPHRIGNPLDPDDVYSIGQMADVTTLDHELVSNDGLSRLEQSGHVVAPSPKSLRFAQDKAFARAEMSRLGFPVPNFKVDVTAADVEDFAAEFGWPVVLKLATMGYDGRGVEIVTDAHSAASVLERDGVWLVEEMLDLRLELAVLVARRRGGETATYPVVETTQVAGICRELVMPARIDQQTRDAAAALALQVVTAVEATGIVAVELFLTEDDELLINELAMRPHNSGHATIEASETSQFHNHLRACLDWPLGSTQMIAGGAAMVNLLGSGSDDAAMRNLPSALAIEGASVHLYAKHERPGRKIGHVTAVGDDSDIALAIARRAVAALEGSS